MKVHDRYDQIISSVKRSPEELASLAADAVRLRHYDTAIELLTPLTRERIPNFAVLYNLAHAYAQKGDWASAVRVHESALLDTEFPETIPNAAWMKRVEKDYYRRWLKLHDAESKLKLPPENLFPLFEGPPPPDAVAIVQQLLLWAPDDVRLYWLLAELYKDRGRPRQALRIYDSLLSQDRQYYRRLVREHREAVAAIVAKLPPEVEVSLADPPDTRSEWEKLGLDNTKLIIGGGAFATITLLMLAFQTRKLIRRRRLSP
ncbi:hypothetical protein BH11PLA2_BH11PLA2_37810 [soil metagenome]